jgi:serine/threonine protein kinase
MEDSSRIELGQGAFGLVFLKNGNAVKQFERLRHIIQEYAALKYLVGCDYIVCVKNVNFKELQLEMELYDSNLISWSANNQQKSDYKELSNKIIHDILCGLIELHDRGLSHGDIKPGNILVKDNPLKAVLGDCGLVSISKYVKTRATTKTYRDPDYGNTSAHDMFSFGICLYELVTNKKMSKKDEVQKTYTDFKNIVNMNVKDNKYNKLIISLLQENKDKRPSARDVLRQLFNETPSLPEKFELLSSEFPENNDIRDIIKVVGYKYKINRITQGYLAVVKFLQKNKIYKEFHEIYSMITLFILSSIFGKPLFNQDLCLKYCSSYKKISSLTFYDIIRELLSDNDYVSTLLYHE